MATIQLLQHGCIQNVSYEATKVCTGIEVDIQHHYVVRSSEESSDISPVVELAIVGIDDEMYISVCHHKFRGSVHVMQGVENCIDVRFDIFDMNGDGNGSYLWLIMATIKR